MMDAKTEQALRESIAKWEKNCAIDDPSRALLTTHECALCRLFHSDETFRVEVDCDGCPVFQSVGEKYCKGTPYIDACRARSARDLENFRAAAKEEVTFLKSLLPENNQ